MGSKGSIHHHHHHHHQHRLPKSTTPKSLVKGHLVLSDPLTASPLAHMIDTHIPCMIDTPHRLRIAAMRAQRKIHSNPAPVLLLIIGMSMCMCVCMCNVRVSASVFVCVCVCVCLLYRCYHHPLALLALLSLSDLLSAATIGSMRIWEAGYACELTQSLLQNRENTAARTVAVSRAVVAVVAVVAVAGVRTVTTAH